MIGGMRRDDEKDMLPAMRYCPPRWYDIWVGALLVAVVILLGVLS